MEILDASARTECLSGHLMPVGLVHLFAQDPPPVERELVGRMFRLAVSDYLHSGLYHSRSSAFRKAAVSRTPSRLRDALTGLRYAEVFVYKEPMIAFAPHLVYDAFPDAPIIYIYRDGRDVAASLQRSYDVLSDATLASLESNETMLGRRVRDIYVPWWVEAGDDEEFLSASAYVRAIWMWREMVKRSDAFFAEVESPARVLRVRYEELVREPTRVGAQIASHVGVPLTTWMKSKLRAASPRSIGAHSAFDSSEIAAAERVAGDELARLGYL
jgi:hypothetical protein